MNRWLWIGSLAGLLVVSTGCLHHQTRGGCSDGSCATGGCPTGNCGQGTGLLGKLNLGCGKNCGGACNGGACNEGACMSGGCNNGACGAVAGCGGNGMCSGACGGVCGGRTGCVAGPLGWQQGGLDYSSHLQPGLLGHHAPAQLNSRPFQPGPPSGQVAYPYYSVRGPRDFLLNDPPTIGR
ncbi:hypothetical protein FYK55_01665 [Roseiconus nitratireducens]|uniref:Uncharacterized protein n=1 Tax=Roseiconus nitratireducens TaxID=2605748 RepID=A0A5M6DL67_9BACT|nr:hypothetical protein [Roseiconus nitratireducens]KAA5547146.1 hypothetical protein FYK55_01665 [Roseiconus nitratireducens]